MYHVLRATTQHSYYVNVMCTATCYLGVVVGAVLHSLVASTTDSWDVGTSVVVVAGVAAAA